MINLFKYDEVKQPITEETFYIIQANALLYAASIARDAWNDASTVINMKTHANNTAYVIERIAKITIDKTNNKN